MICHLDTLLADRGMTLTELADRVGVSIVNLSILKNDRQGGPLLDPDRHLRRPGCHPGDVLDLSD
jgi:putative transcriptional regulator